MGTEARSGPRGALDYVAIVLATGLGAGFSPKAPGTAGSVVGILIVLGMSALGAGAYFPHAIVTCLVAGTWAAGRVESFWGHDAQRIVIDEVAGQMITLSVVVARGALSPLSVIAGFALFRLFDIAKPFPLRRLERLPGGLGVMADDVAAGFYALLVLSTISFSL